MELLIAADGIDLSAVAHLPDKVPAPVIVCSHGLLSAKESPKFVAIGEEMPKAGFCVLRFDFSGCGDSPPRLAMSLVEARRHDLEAAIDFALKQPWSDGRIGLLGSKSWRVPFPSGGKRKPKADSGHRVLGRSVRHRQDSIGYGAYRFGLPGKFGCSKGGGSCSSDSWAIG